MLHRTNVFFDHLVVLMFWAELADGLLPVPTQLYSIAQIKVHQNMDETWIAFDVEELEWPSQNLDVILDTFGMN